MRDWKKDLAGKTVNLAQAMENRIDQSLLDQYNQSMNRTFQYFLAMLKDSVEYFPKKPIGEIFTIGEKGMHFFPSHIDALCEVQKKAQEEKPKSEVIKIV